MPTLRKAIVTVTIGPEYSKLAELTHPAMRQYAKRIGAEFVVIDSVEKSSPTAHFAKYRLYDLLKKYDRILYIDTDALVVPDCPDLFKLVPEGRLGVFLEDDGTRLAGRADEIQKICGKIEGWSGTFFNSGVMVLSSDHRGMFDPGFQQNSLGSEYEQAQLNWNARKLGIPIFDIGKRFNHIVWELDGSRYKSFIIHYVYCCPPRWISRRQKIAQDIFILSWPRPTRPFLISIRCLTDRIITILLKVTLPVRRLFGLYNKSGD